MIESSVYCAHIHAKALESIFEYRINAAREKWSTILPSDCIWRSSIEKMSVAPSYRPVLALETHFSHPIVS